MDGRDEKHLIQKVLKLEKENALLKAQIGNMTSKDFSLTPSDVSNQTSPRIAKPPNYNERDSEEDDDFDKPRPPPDQRTLTKEAQNEREPAKQSNSSDAVGNEDGVKANDTIAHLDNDTVHDGDGKEKTPESVKKTNDEREVNEREEIAGEGGAEGEEKDVAKEDEKSRDQNSWVLVNEDGEKSKDMSDGNYDADNVTELVDRVESAVEATSKDEPGAFDALVAALRILLPLTLFMADELKMLRGNKKDLLLRIRTLMKENQQARLEAEQRVPVVEKKSVATSPEQDETIKEEKCKNGKPEEEEANKQLAIEALKREGKKLRLQVKELQHVNLSWEKYSHKKTSRYEAEMRKMKTKLAASEEKSRKVEKRLADKFREYDQTLIDAKRSEERQKLVGAQYKKERDAYQMKYEEMKRQLKEQDEEIKRLNEVIVRKDTPKVYMKPAAFVVTQQARVVDDKHAAAAARKKPDHHEKQGAAIAAALVATAVGPSANREKGKTKDAKPQKTKQASPPLSPRDPPGYMNDSNPMSLTRAELKDQVVLYKEQIDVYRADFNQERRDREKAVGQVDSLKKELEKTKKKVKEMQRQRLQEEDDLYAAGRLGGRMGFLPEDTQEMRLREIKQQARGKSKYPAHGRHCGEANLDMLEPDLYLPEEHLYADID